MKKLLTRIGLAKQNQQEKNPRLRVAVIKGNYPYIIENLKDILIQPDYFFNLALENNHSFQAWLFLQSCQLDTAHTWFILLSRKELFVTLKLMLEWGLHRQHSIEKSLHFCQDLEILKYCLVYATSLENIHWMDSPLRDNKQNLIQLAAEEKAALARTIEIKQFSQELEQAHLKIRSATPACLKDPAVILFLANLTLGYDWLQKEIQYLPKEIIPIVLEYLALNMFTTMNLTYSRFHYSTALNSLTEQKSTFSLGQFLLSYSKNKPAGETSGLTRIFHHQATANAKKHESSNGLMKNAWLHRSDYAPARFASNHLNLHAFSRSRYA